MQLREGSRFAVRRPYRNLVANAIERGRNECPCCSRPFQVRNGTLVRYWLGKTALCSFACVKVEEELLNMRRV